MAAYEQRKAELEALGVTIYAASADPLERAQEVAGQGLTFPVAYGFTREEAELIGAWWEETRGYVQPSEFLLGPEGLVLGSLYVSGPVGRMDVEEVVRFITNRERRRLEQAAG